VTLGDRLAPRPRGVEVAWPGADPLHVDPDLAIGADGDQRQPG